MPLLSPRQSWNSTIVSRSTDEASTSSSSSTSRSSVTKWALAVVSTYCAGWGVYYLAQDTMRRNVIKKRRQRHQRRVSEASGSKDGDVHRQQAKAIEERFASLSVLGRYCNPFPEWREQGAWEFVVWKTWFVLTTGKLWSDGGVGKLKRSEEGRRRILDTLPSSTPNWSKYGKKSVPSPKTIEEDSWDALSKSELTEKPAAARPAEGSSDRLHYTWIGQSTMLISYAGLNILTDPVFGAQPVASVFSPTRITPTPCTMGELVSNVSLDVVLVSHNHYDHFDASVVPLIPESATWIVPLGMRGLLTTSGKKTQEKIIELDWWQMKELQFSAGQGTLKVQSIPAMHWSARTPLDTNQSLWTSYSLQIASPTSQPAHVYFSGDTGYSPTFFPYLSTVLRTPPHLAFVPIGSYTPRWHMSPQHVSPADSVQIAKDIRARRVVGMHWGTWIMSDEEWDEPPKLLQREVEKCGEGGSDWFGIVRMGETNELVVRD